MPGVGGHRVVKHTGALGDVAALPPGHRMLRQSLPGTILRTGYLDVKAQEVARWIGHRPRNSRELVFSVDGGGQEVLLQNGLLDFGWWNRSTRGIARAAEDRVDRGRIVATLGRRLIQDV